MTNLSRYNRQIILDGFGTEAQQKLLNSSVLIIGAGGLGCPVLQYITAAGVGKIGIIDHDKIDISNLQRQILFNHQDIGKSKAEVAAQKLSLLNPDIQIIAYNQALNPENASLLIAEYDLIIDGTDNFATRYLVNDVCVSLNKPFIAASILQFEGQISVYNYQNGPSYRCLFPEPPQDALTCAEAGVLGAIGGIMGSMQANEAIKVLTGIGETISGKLLIINTLTFEINIIKFRRSKHWNHINPSDYTELCEIPEEILEIKALELKSRIKEVVLIDIRTDLEFKKINIGGIHINEKKLIEEIQKFPEHQEIVICCQRGNRSLQAVKRIRKELNIKNIFSLKGGIEIYSLL